MPNLPLSVEMVALKATLILIGAMLIGFALRRASGNSRHTLWTATTLALLALPILESNLPRLPLSWLPAASATAMAPTESVLSPLNSVASATPVTDHVDALIAVGQVPSTTPSGVRPARPASWLAITWLCGIIGFGIPVLLGVLRSRRLIAQAIPVTDPRLVSRFYQAADDVGVPVDVALRVSPAVRTPMTGGVLHPVVLLPQASLQWSDDCLDAVLRHELVHVRQRDALRQLGARLSVALYWFHPLAWRAARLGALAREMACDELVLRLGTRPSRYARHLLALADPLPAPAGMPALVRLDHPHLEERVMAILRASPPPASRRLSLSAALLIFTWTAAVAAAAPAVRSAVAEEPMRVAATFPDELFAPAPVLGDAALAELDQARQADCENMRDSRARSVSGTNGPVRMFSTEHEGTRICVTVRGDNRDRDTFIPRGRLPNGVVLTLGTGNADGERRLEIEGTARGNEHRWFVDGRARPFDSEAAEWRDAMLSLVGVLTERSEVDRARAVEAMGMARREVERASADMRRTMVAEGRAAARVASAETAARRSMEASRRGDEVRATARLTEHEREAMTRMGAEQAEMAREMARHPRDAAVAGRGVGRSAGGAAVIAPRSARGGAMVAPRAAGRAAIAPRAVGVDQSHERELLEEHRRALEERQVEMRRHAEELRDHARELERDHQRMAEEIRSVAPVISEGRAGSRLRELPTPRALRGVPTPPAMPALREREVTPRELEAADRLRRAIRATGET